MEFIIEITEQLTSLSSFITLPAFMFILSICIGMKFQKAASASINISVGLIGVTILFSFFNETCTPVVNNFMSIVGKQTPIIDTGWPILSLLIWSNKVSYLIIPIAIVVNIMMLAIKCTNTFNIDIWNMWHLAVSSVIVYETTDSLLAVLLVDVLMTVINLKLADWSQPIMMEVYKGRGNVANSHINSLCMLPLAIAGNWVLDRIGERKIISLTPKSGGVKKFFNPLKISLFIGFGMGLVSGTGIIGSMEFAIKISTVFLILPKIVSFMQYGFARMSEEMETFVKEHFNGDNAPIIGVNHMIFSDEDSVIVSSVILMPIAIAASVLLSFIKIFPLADLSSIVCLIVAINAVSKGNILRNVIIGIPAIIINLYATSIMAPLYKIIADKTGYDAGVGNALWNSSLNGNNYISIWVANIFEGKSYAFMIIPFASLLVYMCWRYYKKYTERNQDEIIEEPKYL